MTTLLTREQRWQCPACDFTDVTYEPRPHSRFHSCRGLKGLTAPMVPAGTRCKIEAREREDYIGDELVQTDGEGRPIMSVVTTRDDGTDCTVYAPTAQMRASMPKPEADELFHHFGDISPEARARYRRYRR